jgi:hypothetical protein
MEKNKILIHASPIKIEKLIYRSQHDCKHAMAGYKPCGLWYSPHKNWINWCKKIMPDRCKMYKFFYVVVPRYTTLENPDKNKVLKIQNENDFDEFNFKYGYMHKDTMMNIKWTDVEKDFGGIEIISPYGESARGCESALPDLTSKTEPRLC